MIAFVTSENGKPVRIRTKPEGQIMTTVPVGTQVDIISTNINGWAEIQCGTYHGYMMKQFLARDDSKISKQDLQKIYDSLSESLALIKSILNKED